MGLVVQGKTEQDLTSRDLFHRSNLYDYFYADSGNDAKLPVLFYKWLALRLQIADKLIFHYCLSCRSGAFVV